MSNMATIKNLCPEEKRKIGELLKRLSSETEEKEKLKLMIEQDKRLYESKINSLKEASMCANYNDFKAESFAQSFIGNASVKEAKTSPTVNEIQTLRVKFDELYETVKKAAKTNETLLSRIQKDSFTEDKPMSDLPKPIEQNMNLLPVEDDLNNSVSGNNNILQTSFMDEVKKYSDNEKSFVSSNDDMFNGLLSSSKKSKAGINNIKRVNCNEALTTAPQAPALLHHFNSGRGKYKEMLGRIREKSQEQHTNAISKPQTFNHYQTDRTECQLNQKSHKNNDVSIAQSIQLNIPSDNCIRNSNRENTSLCENNEYKNVLSLLNTNKTSIAKLNSSTIQNENLMTSTSLLSSSSSKLEEVANDNLFNYIFALENKPKPFPVKQEYIIPEPQVTNDNIHNQRNELDEVEREINSLHEKTTEDAKAPVGNKKGFKTKYAKGCNKLYEDFTKINSKYI